MHINDHYVYMAESFQTTEHSSFTGKNQLAIF